MSQFLWMICLVCPSVAELPACSRIAPWQYCSHHRWGCWGTKDGSRMTCTGTRISRYDYTVGAECDFWIRVLILKLNFQYDFCYTTKKNCAGPDAAIKEPNSSLCDWDHILQIWWVWRGVRVNLATTHFVFSVGPTITGVFLVFRNVRQFWNKTSMWGLAILTRIWNSQLHRAQKGREEESGCGTLIPLIKFSGDCWLQIERIHVSK